MRPIITIVVPVYKVEPWLNRCVDSILAQTFRDFELILVDDGSPDRCPAICNEYAARDSRIRVIHQKNGGLSVARMAGVRAATGSYLCFVDSDDFIAPDYLQYLYDLLSTTNGDFSVCGVRRFCDVSELEYFVPSPSSPEQLSASEFLLRQMGPEAEMGVCNRLYRQEIFDAISFEIGRVHEDVLLSVDLADHCHNGVIWGKEEKYFYRQNPNGIMGQSLKKPSPDRIYAGNRVIAFGRTRERSYYQRCLVYAVEAPWMLVDRIYLERSFRENREFLTQLQGLLRENLEVLMELNRFTPIVKKRMGLFARSRVLYGFNAYARLARVYLYRILHLDAYADGHGI